MKNVLMAYFSATGTTAKVAKKIGAVTGGDMFAIQPVTAYTPADLDWNDAGSRSSREMQDKAFRPPIAGKVPHMDQYDTIYVGFPIWWYVAPTIINTFLEAYHLQGKTIIPFATSGGSGMGSTNAGLQPSCSGAQLKAGKRFSSSASEKEIQKWVQSF